MLQVVFFFFLYGALESNIGVFRAKFFATSRGADEFCGYCWGKCFSDVRCFRGIFGDVFIYMRWLVILKMYKSGNS